MKTLVLILFFAILLLPLQILSQIDNKYELDPYRLLQEGVNSITRPDKQIKQILKSENFNDPESRTIINKKILDNGFLLIEKLRQDWYISNWVNGIKYTYTYDMNNKMIEQLEQVWDGSNWVNLWKYTYTYDENNNLIERLSQHWDGSNWGNLYKYTYTYDVNNNMIEWLRQDWDSSNWVNLWKHTYTYDVSNNMIEDLYQEWYISNWVNAHKGTYTYNANNNLIDKVWQRWDGSNWVNNGRWTYTYDLNNNMIEELRQFWVDSNWVNLWKHTYTYDVSNNMIEDLYQEWYISNWVNNSKVTYSHIPTDVEEFKGDVSTYSLSNNFPNPFNPTTTIKYQIPELSFVSLIVYDVIGNEIETLINEKKPAGTYEVTWYAEGLPSGIYFYQLLVSALQSKDGKAGEYIQTKKMVLLK